MFDHIDPDELRSCDISYGPFMDFVFDKKIKIKAAFNFPRLLFFYFVMHRKPQHPPWQDILTLSFPSGPGNIRHVCDVHSRTLAQKYLLIIGKHLAYDVIRGVEKCSKQILVPLRVRINGNKVVLSK